MFKLTCNCGTDTHSDVDNRVGKYALNGCNKMPSDSAPLFFFIQGHPIRPTVLCIKEDMHHCSSVRWHPTSWRSMGLIVDGQIAVRNCDRSPRPSIERSTSVWQ